MIKKYIPIIFLIGLVMLLPSLQMDTSFDDNFIFHDLNELNSYDIYLAFQKQEVYPILFISLDRWKYTVEWEEIKKFLERNDVDESWYIPEHHDCDDFAFQLFGDIIKFNGDIAFGVLIIYKEECGHALNFFIDKNLSIWIVEPQSDAIYPIRRLIDGGWNFYCVIV